MNIFKLGDGTRVFVAGCGGMLGAAVFSGVVIFESRFAIAYISITFPRLRPSGISVSSTVSGISFELMESEDAETAAAGIKSPALICLKTTPPII